MKPEHVAELLDALRDALNREHPANVAATRGSTRQWSACDLRQHTGCDLEPCS